MSWKQKKKKLGELVSSITTGTTGMSWKWAEDLNVGTEDTAAAEFYINPFTSEVRRNTFLMMEVAVIPTKEEGFFCHGFPFGTLKRISFINQALKCLMGKNREHQSTIVQLKDH